jgi:four helix bundle protein
MKESPLKNKSYSFSIRIVNLAKAIREDKKEFVLSKQILKSGTAIGALIREAEFGQSRADFTNKMSIALKEANETDYWLCLLSDTNSISKETFKSYQSDCNELIAMLVSTIKTTKNK